MSFVSVLIVRLDELLRCATSLADTRTGITAGTTSPRSQYKSPHKILIKLPWNLKSNQSTKNHILLWKFSNKMINIATIFFAAPFPLQVLSSQEWL